MSTVVVPRMRKMRTPMTIWRVRLLDIIQKAKIKMQDAN